jgi:hypothetical protein
MHVLYASLVASIVGYFFDDLVGSHLPLGLRVVAGLVVSAVAYYYTSRFFKQLKEDIGG